MTGVQTCALPISRLRGDTHTISHTHTHTHSVCTCVVLPADAGVAPLPPSAHPSVEAGVGVAQVDLRLAVVPSEAGGAAAAEPCDGGLGDDAFKMCYCSQTIVGRGGGRGGLRGQPALFEVCV